MVGELGLLHGDLEALLLGGARHDEVRAGVLELLLHLGELLGRHGVRSRGDGPLHKNLRGPLPRGGPRRLGLPDLFTFLSLASAELHKSPLSRVFRRRF